MFKIMAVNLIELLEKYRVEHRYSQVELAELIGTSQPSYCRWLCGKGQIPYKQYPVIAKLLGRRLKDILPSEFQEED